MANLFGSDYTVDKQGKRLLAIAFVITLTLSFAFPSGSVVTNDYSSPPLTVQQVVIADSYGSLNATDLWTEIWNATSLSLVTNYVRDISEDYPNRTWFLSNMSPSSNLEGAWTWANQTLDTNTDGVLSFEQITSFQSLLAIKAGTDPAPRPAIVISGVIDSKESPGANDAGSSVSAVLETARILHNYTFACDIYYVLLNGGRVDDDTSLGGKALVEWLEDNDIDTLTALEYDRLIYQDAGHAASPRIHLRAVAIDGIYQSDNWFSDIMVEVSNSFGDGRIFIATDYVRTEGTLTYEMWQVGRPAIHVVQGYIFEEISGSALDTWDYTDYNYAKIQEAVASVASVVS
ncbi:MAG: M28 family peptidase, partial [Candidatus Thorarchaeota archaeon]